MSDYWEFADYKFYPHERRLWRAGHRIGEKLVTKDFEVLQLLVEKCQNTVTKEEFLRTVWQGKYVDEQVLANCISNLRQAFEDKPSDPEVIATKAGRGYFFLLKAVKQCDEVGGQSALRIVKSDFQLLEELLSIVNGAEECLVTTGSRSRDREYLRAIEERLERLPSLVHYRVLFGNPQNEDFRQHLLALLNIRNPRDRTYHHQTIHIGLFKDFFREAERSICANEKKALIVLPSILNGLGRYDTALIIENEEEVRGIRRYIHELYHASQLIEDVEVVRNLPISRPKTATRGY